MAPNHEHQRSDNSHTYTHSRWMDSTKVQLVILSAVVGLLVGAAGVGSAATTWLASVNEAPNVIEAHMRVDSAWTTRHDLIIHGGIDQRLDVLLEVAACDVLSDGPEDTAVCLSDRTRVYLQRYARGQINGGGGDQ